MKSLRFLSVFFAFAFIAVTGAEPVMAEQSASGGGTGTNYETRLSGLEDEMRAMNGRVEQLEFAVRRLDQTIQRMQTDLDARLQRLESAAAAPPQAAVPQQTPPPTASAIPNSTEPPAAMENPGGGTLGGLKLQNGKVVGGDVNPQAPPLPATPPDYGLTPEEQYDDAFALLRQADYDGAGKAFKDFIDKNPKNKMLGNAKYFYGETLYVRGKLDEAAVAFADAWQQDPQGPKAPDSLMQLAMSLAAIGKTQDACTAIGELKTKYPGASPTIRSRANEESTKIKCNAH